MNMVASGTADEAGTGEGRVRGATGTGEGRATGGDGGSEPVGITFVADASAGAPTPTGAIGAIPFLVAEAITTPAATVALGIRRTDGIAA
jgi:hypothetical protein